MFDFLEMRVQHNNNVESLLCKDFIQNILCHQNVLFFNTGWHQPLFFLKFLLAKKDRLMCVSVRAYARACMRATECDMHCRVRVQFGCNYDYYDECYYCYYYDYYDNLG